MCHPLHVSVLPVVFHSLPQSPNEKNFPDEKAEVSKGHVTCPASVGHLESPLCGPLSVSSTLV